MSRLERIWLIQTPSRAGEAWRTALAAACAERGWAFATHERGENAPIPDPERSQLTVSWIDWSEGQPVTHWCVQNGGPEDSPAVLAERDALSDNDALYEGSLRLACADHVARNGAIVVSSEDDVIVLPGLGAVRRPADAPRTPVDTRHPLDLYRTFPLRPGRSIRWGPEHFVYADPLAGATRNGVISLVGRRRLLFTGPPIFLSPGRWRFEGEFSIEPPGESELAIEWGYGEEAQTLSAVITHSGRYSVVLEQAWTRVACADFRISMLIPALEGQLEFHGGVLTRLEDLPEARAAFAESPEPELAPA